MKIVISGFYGLGNTGDEAILEAIISEIRRKDPAAEITVFSLSPDETSKRHHVKSIYRGWRRAMKEKIKALRQADVLISGGGGLLQDRYPTRVIGGPLPYYLLIALLARLLGSKVMFFSQGIGPVTSRYGRFLMATLGNLPYLITVRDEESKKLAESLGIKRAIEVTADVVFAHEAPEGTACTDSLSEPFGARKRIGVSVRPWFSDTHHYDAVANACDHYLALGYEVVMIPMEGHHDVRASNEVRNRLEEPGHAFFTILEAGFEPRDYLAFVKTCDFVIGMRLHALIFSVIQEVPHTAISYDPKVEQLMRRTGLSGYWLPFATLSGEEMILVTDHLIRNRRDVSRQLSSMHQELRIEAKRNIDRLYETMDQT